MIKTVTSPFHYLISMLRLCYVIYIMLCFDENEDGFDYIDCDLFDQRKTIVVYKITLLIS